MSIFKKRRHSLSPKQDQLAGRIADGILKGQRKVADHLNRKTAGVSGKALKSGLILFLVLFGSYFLHVLIRAFQ